MTWQIHRPAPFTALWRDMLTHPSPPPSLNDYLLFLLPAISTTSRRSPDWEKCLAIFSGGGGWQIISSEWSERSGGININGRIYFVSVTTHSPISFHGLSDEARREKKGLVKIALYLYYTVEHPQIGIGFNDASSLCDGRSSDDLSPEAPHWYLKVDR